MRDMELELRKGGVKMRWSIRSEDEGGYENDEQEVVATNFWVKGMMDVDFRNMRVTSMKGHRRYIIPGPCKRGGFEINWRMLELECLKVTKDVKNILLRKHEGQRFYNLDKEEEAGVRKLVKRRTEEGVL